MKEGRKGEMVRMRVIEKLGGGICNVEIVIVAIKRKGRIAKGRSYLRS